MKIVLFIIVSFWPFCGFAQDSSKLVKFITVSMPHGAPNYGLNTLEWNAYYSDGSIKNMNQILTLSPQRSDYKNDSIMAQYEFKMLTYFYGKGYELISVAQQR
jgi:hypothetical protein